MFKENRNLLIISLIVVVNALGYGIIIPILYSYSQKFGMSDFQNGLLFALFSICQFLSTPIIGRLSDKYGRKPLLVASIAGTALSFIMLAFAPNIIFVFLARALDGITAGNIPVAQAVISDTTTEKNRAKGFGIIGAAFGFGFVFGPAISAFTVGYWDALPFIIAATISIIAVILTALYLPETNKHMGEVSHAKLFDFTKLYQALYYPNVGVTLVITLFFSVAFSLFFYAFQPFSVKALHLTVNQISYLFVLFGVVGLITQAFLVQHIVKKFPVKKTFSVALLGVSVAFMGMFFTHTLPVFIVFCLILAFFNSISQPLTATLLSEETDAKSQGTIMGISASYMSVGQIIGPILGGAIATIGVHYPFILGSIVALFCFYLSFQIFKPGVHVPKESAF